jgi:trans-aconitate 2-methyltransferase
MSSRDLEQARLARLARLVSALPADLPAGPVLDLGCGEGGAAPLLRARFPDHRLEGLDRDGPALAGAAALYDVVHRHDLVTWEPQEPYSLIFAAAVLHQTGSLAAVLPWFLRCLNPGGVLAFSLPRNETLAVTALMHRAAALRFPGRSPDLVQPEGHMEELHRILAPQGETRIWAHEELRLLRPAREGHPIRLVTEESLVRPLLDSLDPEEVELCLEAIDECLHERYPVDPVHGTALRLREIYAVCRVGGYL